MRGFITNVLALLVIALIALVAATLVTAGFIGVGMLLARFTELTLFQATAVTVPVGLGTFYLLSRIMNVPVTNHEDEWDEWEDWDDDLDFEDMPPEARRDAIRRLREYLDELEAQTDAELEPPHHRKRRRR